MNYSDLFVVIAFATGLYGLIVALARQRQFLTKAVNPHRGAWLLAGVAAAWFGVGVLKFESRSWDPTEWVNVMRALVTDQPLSTAGKIAAIAVLLGLLLMFLVVWCRFNFPRDPSTFRRPADQDRALRYYVSRLKGGLDYGTIMRPGGERLAESWHEAHVRETIPHLPRVTAASEPAPRTLDDQIAFWRATAERLHHSMASLDHVIDPARQGTNRRIVFDCEYGGIFFAYLRPPVKSPTDPDAVFVFAATLDQEAMNNRQADAHFELLLRAVKQIDAAVRIA